MFRVDRPTIGVYIGQEADALDLRLALVVAVDAQALQRTRAEAVVVTLVRDDMVSDPCRGHLALVEACFAQRVDAQLVGTALAPCCAAVPVDVVGAAHASPSWCA